MNYQRLYTNFYMCEIYSTDPFDTQNKLIYSLELLIKEQAYVLTLVEIFGYKIQRAFSINADNQVEYIRSESINKISQNLAHVYYDAGQQYWFNLVSFLTEKSQSDLAKVQFFLKDSKVQIVDYFSRAVQVQI